MSHRLAPARLPGALPRRPGIRPSVRRGGESGMALVITLSFVVLATITAMAFFVRATSNRLIESSRANQVLVQQVTSTATDYIAGQFQREIADKATSTNTTDGITIYGQTNNVFAVPQRPIASTLAANPDFANLLRRSISETVNGIGEDDASDHSTAAPSMNGRVISPARWNAPRLLGGDGFTADDQLPNWIYLNRDGTVTATPTTDAIGRFAYNVYDTGGLLDINAFGHGAGMPFVFRKGSPATADLTVLPGIAAGATTTDGTLSWPPSWRLTGPWAQFRPGTGSFPHYHEKGWLKPWPGDRMFASRQDLIRYAQANPGTFETLGDSIPALQYLTTFSRDLDAPSFAPNPDRSKIRSLANGGNDAFGLDDVINPDLGNVRVTTAFTRPDGSAARPGDPLLTNRFPLSRLALLTADATATRSQSDAIYRSFGLSRSSDSEPWVYDHGDPANILRLPDVATAGREPDMIELLKAAITAGSVGKSSGVQSRVQPPGTGLGDVNYQADDVYRNQTDRSLNYQIVQIAANIIDQADEDGFPTRIIFDGREFYGVENLPYLSSIRRAHTITGPAVDGAFPGAVIYQYELWNPHDQTTLPAARPTSFRIIADGQGAVSTVGQGRTNQAPIIPPWPDPQNLRVPYSLNSGNSGVTFSSTNTNYFQPTFLTPANAFAESGAGVITGVNPIDQNTYLGSFLCTNEWRNPLNRLQAAMMVADGEGIAIFTTAPGTDFKLQFNSPDGWVTYDEVKNFTCNVGWRTPVNLFTTRYRVDPRTSRFGLPGGPGGGTRDENPISSTAQNSAWPWLEEKFPEFRGGWGYLPALPDIGLGKFSKNDAAVGPDNDGLGWSPGKASANFWDKGWWMATISRNVENPDYVRYTDPDGVLRRADGAFANGTEGLPLINNNTPSRPIILNRPFRSVGELGYVFRGTPWKSLDFFTPESGDAALLDIFCIDEPAPGGLTAGRVNLNTRQRPVLKALLVGGGKLDDGSRNLTEAEAEALAQALVDRTTSTAANQGPLLDRSDLVGRNTGGTSYTGFSAEVGSHLTGPDAAIKRRLEAPVRALADVGTTRSWNVLVDVIAQSGRFPAGGGTAADNFVVEAENRVWEHLAIDRHTARIIARSHETVTD